MIVVYGSPKIHGCFMLLVCFDQPLMIIQAGVNAFHCRSRTWVCALPPKIPSTSPVAALNPERPAPITVGMWKRMYSQLPDWSPDQIVENRCPPAQAHVVHTKPRASAFFSMPS